MLTVVDHEGPFRKVIGFVVPVMNVGPTTEGASYQPRSRPTSSGTRRYFYDMIS